MKTMQRGMLAVSLGLAGGLASTSAVLAGMGQPSPRQIGLQDAATDIAEQIHSLYNLVNIVIIVIAVVVLALLIWVVVRFNEKANPTPARGGSGRSNCLEQNPLYGQTSKSNQTDLKF